MSLQSRVDRNQKAGLSLVDRRQVDTARERLQPAEADVPKENLKQPEENLKDQYTALEEAAGTVGKKMFAEMQAICGPADVRGIKQLLSEESSEGVSGTREVAQFFLAQLRESQFTGENHDPDLLKKVVFAHLEATARTCRDLPTQGAQGMGLEERKKRNAQLGLIAGERVSRASASLARLAIDAEQKKLLGMHN